MKLGYFSLTDNPPAYQETRQDPQAILRALVREAEFAEELGFNSVWVPEHHLGLFGVLPSPSMFLAHIAAKTQRVQLAPATVLLPVNHPVRMAEEYALLDVLSEGRVIFSAGRGYDRREYELYGVDFDQSQALFFEQLDIIKGVWTHPDRFSYEGQFYYIPEMELVPRPVQHPHPPIYVASFSRPSLEKAATMGENVIFAPFAAAMVFGSVQEAVAHFRELSAQHGHAGRAKCSYFVNVVDSRAEWEATNRRMLKYFKGIVPAFPSDPATTPPHIRYFLDIVQRLTAMEEKDLSERSIINGDAEHCIRVLTQVAEAGIDEVICYFNFGGLEHKETMRNMERFATKVMPYIPQ